MTAAAGHRARWVADPDGLVGQGGGGQDELPDQADLSGQVRAEGMDLEGSTPVGRHILARGFPRPDADRDGLARLRSGYPPRRYAGMSMPAAWRASVCTQYNVCRSEWQAGSALLDREGRF